MTAPGAYCVSQTITCSFAVPGRTLFRRGVCVIPTLSPASADPGSAMQTTPISKMMIILAWDEFANLCLPEADPSMMILARYT